MGELTYRLVFFTLQILVMTFLMFIIALPLLWGLQRKRPSLLKTLLLNLLAALSYMITHLLFLYVLFPWTHQYYNIPGLVAEFITPPIIVFVVYLLILIKYLEFRPLSAGFASIIFAILSYFLYWTSSFILYPLVPFLWVIKSWSTP